MYCPKCGKEINNQDKFCPFCGKGFSAYELSNRNTFGAERKNKKGKKIIKTVIIFVFAVGAISIFALFKSNIVKQNKAVSSDSIRNNSNTSEFYHNSTSSFNGAVQPEKNIIKEIEETTALSTWESLSTSEKKDINIFLSNFAEADIYYLDSSMEDRLIDFAVIHNLINTNNTNYEFDLLSLDATFVQNTIYKFFGINVPDQSTYQFSYVDGAYHWKRSEVNYLKFVQINSLEDNKDGTFTAHFDVYILPDGYYDSVPQEAYYPMDYWEDPFKDVPEYKVSGDANIKSIVNAEAKSYQAISFMIYAQ